MKEITLQSYQKLFGDNCSSGLLQAPPLLAEKEDYDSVADYIERVAREEMDYVKSGEVVYINIAGN